jgi:hypothetical protein
MWVAVGLGSYSSNFQYNTISYSYDGINWTVSNNSTSIFSNSGNGIAWNGSIWVAVGSGTTNTIAYSSDGINWTGSNNSLGIFSNGGTVIQTISWNGSAYGFNPIGLCAGVYNFTIVDAAGCTVSGTTTLTNPAPIVVGPIIASDTVCFNTTNEVYNVPDLGAGFTYQWSSIGNIISGQGTTSITVDYTSIPAGFIPGVVNVTALSPNGCTSIPASFDITVFNILPVIDPAGPFCSNDEFSTLNATPIGGIFSGTGMMGADFYPSFADTLDNFITYPLRIEPENMRNNKVNYSYLETNYEKYGYKCWLADNDDGTKEVKWENNKTGTNLDLIMSFCKEINSKKDKTDKSRLAAFGFLHFKSLGIPTSDLLNLSIPNILKKYKIEELFKNRKTQYLEKLIKLSEN